MQDQETDTYWSIMTGEAIAGKMHKTKLAELPVSEKMQWKDWVKKYPNTAVLSVDGEEESPVDYYSNYFKSEQGFRKLKAKDKRLRTKEPIFAFQYENRKIAIPHSAFWGGKAFDIGGESVFLFRSPTDAIFASTKAFIAPANTFKKQNEQWIETSSQHFFDAKSGKFTGNKSENESPKPLNGFDTFWYNWSLTNKETEVIKK